MLSEDQPQIININELDIWADEWDDLVLTTEQEDALIERERLRQSMFIIPTVPCECFFCRIGLTIQNFSI